MDQIVFVFIQLAGIYLLIGLFFAIYFINKGLPLVDPSAKNSTLWFKIVIVPGLAAFWVVFLKKWIKAKKQ